MDIIGPAMPPGMNIIDKESSEEESIDPKLPQHLKNSKRDYSKTESFHIGPQLPDHLTREKSYNRGPSLPPDIQPKGDNSSSARGHCWSNNIHPTRTAFPQVRW
jgi:hypothetical protein